eukprot:m.22924 g.22924  ORF g.22924 m.22924 type:complete len:153 (-) comp12844_c0_seq1:35-493(-)
MLMIYAWTTNTMEGRQNHFISSRSQYDAVALCDNSSSAVKSPNLSSTGCVNLLLCGEEIGAVRNLKPGQYTAKQIVTAVSSLLQTVSFSPAQYSKMRAKKGRDLTSSAFKLIDFSFEKRNFVSDMPDRYVLQGCSTMCPNRLFIVPPVLELF